MRMCLVIAMFVAATVVPPQTSAQAPRRGWLEGTVRDEFGKPAVGGSGGVWVNVYGSDGREVKSAAPAESTGGLYTIADLDPGLYEVRLVRSNFGDVKVAPQRVFGVLVSAGLRTILNFVAKPGDEILEIGKPAVATQNAIVISEELKRLQAEIDQLKKDLAGLKRGTP